MHAYVHTYLHAYIGVCINVYLAHTYNIARCFQQESFEILAEITQVYTQAMSSSNKARILLYKQHAVFRDLHAVVLPARSTVARKSKQYRRVALNL